MPRNFSVSLIIGVAPSLGFAHSSNGNSSLLHLEPWVLLPLSVITVLYIIGLIRIRRHRVWNNLRRKILYFSLALLCLLLALVWPLEVLSGRSFAAHMLQHMLLLSVAAPLLALARPLPILLAALPRTSRRALILKYRRSYLRPWRFLSRPTIAFALHAVIIWAWHAPAAFQLALENDAFHILEHFMFLTSAHLFWWSMFHRGGNRVRRYGANTLWMLSTLIHTGFLGALLTFAGYPLYSYYLLQAKAEGLLWNLSPLEDQQLGGTFMWVLGAGPYFVGGLVLALYCLRALERRTELPQSQT